MLVHHSGLSGENSTFFLNIMLRINYREHEYLKHGTCCTGISSMATEYGFFLTTLNLYKKYQIYE